MIKFTSSPDRTSKILTWFVPCLAVILCFVSYTVYERSGSTAAMCLAIGPVLLVIIFVAMFYLKPLSITLSDSSITIDRRINPVSISFSEIKAIRILSQDKMGFPFRTFGDGGVFGYLGLYYSRRLGSMRWYCTQRENYTLIEKTDGKKIIITPDHPEELLRELKMIQPSLVQAA
jgi:PH (Pleckstrin Homology) domain-containing protein